VADRQFVSITVNTRDLLPVHAENQGAVGIDLGVNTIDGKDCSKSQGTYHTFSEIAPSLTEIKPEAAEIPQPREGRAETGQATCPDCQHPRGRASQANHGFSMAVLLDWHRGPKCQWLMQNRHLAHPISDMSFHEFRR